MTASDDIPALRPSFRLEFGEDAYIVELSEADQRVPVLRVRIARAAVDRVVHAATTLSHELRLDGTVVTYAQTARSAVRAVPAVGKFQLRMCLPVWCSPGGVALPAQPHTSQLSVSAC